VGDLVTLLSERDAIPTIRQIMDIPDRESTSDEEMT
jgi:hypothetical protein